MPEPTLTLEMLRAELAPIHSRLDNIETRLAGMQIELGSILARVDGVPLLNRAITVLQQDTRMLRAAFNDFAHTNLTSGEVESLHTDVNRVQADYTELATRVATLERRLQERQSP